MREAGSRQRRRAQILMAIVWLVIWGLGAFVMPGASAHAPSSSSQPLTRIPIVTPTPTTVPTATPTASPIPLPDLVVVSVTTDPSPLITGRPGTVHIEVRNIGAAGTAAMCWVGLYIDRAPVGDPNQQTFCPALGVDQSSIVLYTVTLANAGYHSFTAWVDFLGAIAEEDESNNQHSVYILVAEPTLTPTSTQTPSPSATFLPTATRTATASPTSTGTPTLTLTPSRTLTPRPGQPDNPVFNGAFEGGFVSHGQLGNVADGWTPFVDTGGPPQFLRGQEHAKGLSSQRIWSDYVPFRAGIYQRVVGVAAGQAYTASAEALSIFGEGNTPVPGMNIGKQIGLDPQGGDNPSSPSIIWSAPKWEDRAWQEGAGALQVSATAQTGVITVFIRVHNVYGGHNDLFYVDNVALQPVGLIPTATHTPSPTMTETPIPTFTAAPYLLGTSTPTLIPMWGTAVATTPTTPGEQEALPTAASTPEEPRPTRLIVRLIPVFFGLALVVIFVLIAAIVWLQQGDE